MKQYFRFRSIIQSTAMLAVLAWGAPSSGDFYKGWRSVDAEIEQSGLNESDHFFEGLALLTSPPKRWSHELDLEWGAPLQRPRIIDLPDDSIAMRSVLIESSTIPARRPEITLRTDAEILLRYLERNAADAENGPLLRDNTIILNPFVAWVDSPSQRPNLDPLSQFRPLIPVRRPPFEIVDSDSGNRLIVEKSASGLDTSEHSDGNEWITSLKYPVFNSNYDSQVQVQDGNRSVEIAGLLELGTPQHRRPSLEEINCLADALYFEARGEAPEGQLAVAEVILNRVSSPLYPDNICGVVRQGGGNKAQCQFSFYCDGRPESVANTDVYKYLRELSSRVLDGEYPEITNGATHFHSVHVSPSWAKNLDRTALFGKHIFYAN